ncbi:hypothetical protein F5Y17DRAFT_311925 [Xylariaceae sp. FL0594]|nr:hypothetical protein F5Y17DRAFT_311925 [Xylariaceae sp. FL0594]
MSSDLHVLPDNPTDEDIARKLLHVAFHPVGDEVNADIALTYADGDIFKAFRSINELVNRYGPNKMDQDADAFADSGVPEWPETGAVEAGQSTTATYHAAMNEGRIVKVANIATDLSKKQVEDYIHGQPECHRLAVHWPPLQDIPEGHNAGTCFIEVPNLEWAAYTVHILRGMRIGKGGSLTTAEQLDYRK